MKPTISTKIQQEQKLREFYESDIKKVSIEGILLPRNITVKNVDRLENWKVGFISRKGSYCLKLWKKGSIKGTEINIPIDIAINYIDDTRIKLIKVKDVVISVAILRPIIQDYLDMLELLTESVEGDGLIAEYKGE